MLRAGASEEEVMAGLGPLARRVVGTAKAFRATLSEVKILLKLRVAMTAKEARDVGVRVLRPKDPVSDPDDPMTVGMFNVPRLDASIVKPPKTFDFLATEPLPFLLLPQRIERAMELVDAVVARKPLGIHLSGPNGVGKSGVLLLAYLVCAARSIPAIYVSRTTSWVKAASENNGDAYLLKTFWHQNVDLIVKSPALRTVFADALLDKANPFNHAMWTKLQDTLSSVLHKGVEPNIPGIAVLLDEVQNITNAVNRSEKAPSAGDAGSYFVSTWHSWNNDNFVFQRLSAASAHSFRDYDLPDGEEPRLRIMAPLDDADSVALLEYPQSPAYAHKDARARITDTAGGILCKLITAAYLLPSKRAPSKKELTVLWDTMWAPMVTDCNRWLESLPSDEHREDAAANVMQLLKGEVKWGGALVLYDAGIVFRSANLRNLSVLPVSAAANAVLLHVMAAYIRTHRKHLSTIPNAALRGYEFESQVLASLNPFNGLPQCTHLNGDPADALEIRCGYALPFSDLGLASWRDAPVLYRPFNPNFPCDGIVMPANDDAKPRIYLIECSVTEPTDDNRVEKVAKWFSAGGLIPELQHLHPGVPITVLLCYSGQLVRRKSLPKAANNLSCRAAAATTSAGAAVAVVSRPAAAVTNTASGGAAGGPIELRVVDGPLLRCAIRVLL